MAVFTYTEGSMLLRLLAAHLLTDFYIQPTKWVTQKNSKGLTSVYLWYHALATGMAAWLLLWNLRLWWVVPFISITHLLIDAGKIYWSKKIANSNNHIAKKAQQQFHLFVADQCLHLLVSGVAWLYIINGFTKLYSSLQQWLPGYHTLLLLTGYLLVLQPSSYFIGFLTKRWLPELNMSDSLAGAGAWIGMLERALVLTFIYSNQFAAIGFLIAAKSILRVTDKPEKVNEATAQPFSSRKHTEYVLIGTFLSFGIALVTGLLVNYLLTL